MKPSRVDLTIAAVFCGVIGLYDTLYVLFLLAGGPLIGPNADVLFPDFLVFHAAAQAAIEGKLSIIYDTAALTDLQNKLYASRLPFELGFRPFLYPPFWLLALLPFGLMSIGLAVASFLTIGFVLCVAALRSLKLGWPATLAILTAPAVVWAVIAGQNTFFSVALLYSGLALLERRPVVAGVVLGLLSYKPQLWLLVPLALLAARAWRPLAAAAATVALLTLVTLLVFGTNIWFDFINAAQHTSQGASPTEMYSRLHTQITTPLAAAKILGLNDSIAVTLQTAGAALAVGAVAWAFHRYPTSDARTAVLVAATFLASPYTLNYDLLLLMPAATLLFLHPPPDGYRTGERMTYLLVWLLPTVSLVLNRDGHPITPLVVLFFGGMAWMRLTARPKTSFKTCATT